MTAVLFFTCAALSIIFGVIKNFIMSFIETDKSLVHILSAFISILFVIGYFYLGYHPTSTSAFVCSIILATLNGLGAMGGLVEIAEGKKEGVLSFMRCTPLCVLFIITAATNF